jgi:hypothetical protein
LEVDETHFLAGSRRVTPSSLKARTDVEGVFRPLAAVVHNDEKPGGDHCEAGEATLQLSSVHRVFPSDDTSEFDLLDQISGPLPTGHAAAVARHRRHGDPSAGLGRSATMSTFNFRAPRLKRFEKEASWAWARVVC